MDKGVSPAPWAHSPVYNGNGHLVYDHIVDANGLVIAEVHDDRDVPVIAAAPELLAKLEIAVGVIEASNMLWMGLDGAKDVIAKARGNAPERTTP